MDLKKGKLPGRIKKIHIFAMISKYDAGWLLIKGGGERIGADACDIFSVVYRL